MKIIVVIFCNILQMESNITNFLKSQNIEMSNVDSLLFSKKCSLAKQKIKKELDKKYHNLVNKVFEIYFKQNELRNDIVHGRFLTAKYSGQSIFLKDVIEEIESDLSLIREEIFLIKNGVERDVSINVL